jgi:hypothetical protein
MLNNVHDLVHIDWPALRGSTIVERPDHVSIDLHLGLVG